MYNAVCFLSRQFKKGVEDDAGPEGEADEGYWAHPEVPLDKHVCEDPTGGFGTVKSVAPGIVD